MSDGPDYELKPFDDERIQETRPPDWVSNAVFYQIFPDRFHNGNPASNPENVEEWENDPSRKNFFGGDLAGIEDKLSYLDRLGINALYLNPLFKSPSNHKYDTTSYYEIDPQFGNKSDLVSLVESLHEIGIRVILDGVFNHCGESFPRFQDVKKEGRNSEYWNWFQVDDFPVEKEPEPNYRCWAGVPEMPEFDRTNPEVRRFLLEVVQYWIKEADIDGWRLDTVHYLEPGFVRSVRSAAMAVKEEAYVMGEVMGPAASWFKSSSLDGVMNYELYDLLLEFFVVNDLDAREFKRELYFLRRSYPGWANFANYNLLSSHDRPRLMTLCNGDIDLFKKAYFFLFTLPGTPAIYYGDEIGMEGGDDPDCRRPYPWSQDRYRKDLLNYFRSLISLRKEEPALRLGNFRELSADESVFSYSRTKGDEVIIGAVNSASESRSHEIDVKGFAGSSDAEMIFGRGSFSARDEKINLSLPGQGYLLLKINSSLTHRS